MSANHFVQFFECILLIRWGGIYNVLSTALQFSGQMKWSALQSNILHVFRAWLWYYLLVCAPGLFNEYRCSSPMRFIAFYSYVIGSVKSVACHVRASSGVLCQSQGSQKHKTEQYWMYLCVVIRLKRSFILFARNCTLAKSIIRRVNQPLLTSRRSLHSTPPCLSRFRVGLWAPGNPPAATWNGITPACRCSSGKESRAFMSKCPLWLDSSSCNRVSHDI